ncbi:MAG: arginine repressor [Ignavibacteriaceae bacterium]
MSAKLKRLNRIKELLNNRYISSHDNLAKMLDAEGIMVTQATLSRDFAELGVIRAISEKGPRYILDSHESGKQIAKLIGFEIMSVQNNESLIVVRTLAGRAQGIAHFIDRLNKPEIIGTVAGDDTVLVIPSSHSHIANLVSLIKKMMTEQVG